MEEPIGMNQGRHSAPSAVVLAYLRHYNRARPHRTLDQRTPAHAETSLPLADLAGREIRRESVVDGLINEYHLAA